MLKILQVSDTHLDGKFSGMRQKGTLRRQELREVFKRAMDLALEKKVDIVFLVGDVFESLRVSPDTIDFIKATLQQMEPIPIFIAPGNQDPYVVDSPYATSGWPRNVHIFPTNRFTAVELPQFGTVIHGIAHISFGDKNNYLKDLRLPRDGRRHIVLMHGSDLQGIPPAKETCFPFHREDIESCGAQYIALGHYHGAKNIPEDSEIPLACYSGAPEFMSFDEVSDKGVLLVEIDRKKTRTRLIPTWKRRYLIEYMNCQGMATQEQIGDAVRKLSEKKGYEDCLMKVILVGEISPELVIDIDAIMDRLKDDFFFLRVEDLTRVAYDVEELKIEKSTRAEFIHRMEEKLAQLPRGEKEKRKVLERALYYGLDAFLRPKVTER